MPKLGGYARKLRTYAAPGYWARVVRVHGPSGVPREVLRIIRPTRKDWSALERAHVDFSDTASSPAEALELAERAGPDKTARLRVPLSRLRHARLGVSVADEMANPFTASVVSFLDGPETSYAESPMRRFLDAWQPRTIAEFVGLDPVPESSLLADPIEVDVLPWEENTGRDQLVRAREAHELRMLAKFGSSPGGRHGYDYFGPTSDALGGYRYRKYCRVAEAIAEEGFDEQSHVIDTQLLDADGDWGLLVRDGKHRTAALAALGHQDVVVALPGDYPVIRRSEVDTWPAVVAGLYTREQGLEVFDRFVAGRSPVRPGVT